jgi:hypothetical protein
MNGETTETDGQVPEGLGRLTLDLAHPDVIDCLRVLHKKIGVGSDGYLAFKIRDCAGSHWATSFDGNGCISRLIVFPKSTLNSSLQYDIPLPILAICQHTFQATRDNTFRTNQLLQHL